MVRSRRLMVADLLLTLAILGCLTLIVARIDRTNEDRLSGRVRVIDGDTLALGTLRMRLLGIDAPERAQICRRQGADWACGEAARARLRDLAGAAPVDCVTRRRDRYGRALATCEAGGRILNAAMVEEGYAVAYGDYAAQEMLARGEMRGLWAGTFDPPQRWRETHGGMTEAPHITAEGLKALWRRIEDIWTER